MEKVKIGGFDGKLIDNIRYILLLGVILIHCKIAIPDSHNQDMEMAVFTISFISNIVTSVCVPFYFLISSFLFFRNVDKFNFFTYKSKLKRRLKSLLIPYLLWNIIGMAAMLIKMLPALREYFPQYTVIDLTSLNLLKGFWSFSLINCSLVPYPYDFVLWFIRDLMVLNLLSPVFYLVAKKMKYWGFLILLSLLVLNDIDLINVDVNLKEIFFYYIGVLIGCKAIDINRFIQYGKYCIIPMVFFAFCSQFNRMSTYGNLILLAYIIFCIPSLTFMVSWFMKHGLVIPNYFLRSGFFVYAIHGLYCTVSIKILIALIHPDTPETYLLVYILDFTSVLVVSSLVFLIMRNICPKVTSLLCGGRT